MRSCYATGGPAFYGEAPAASVTVGASGEQPAGGGGGAQPSAERDQKRAATSEHTEAGRRRPRNLGNPRTEVRGHRGGDTTRTARTDDIRYKYS